MAEPRSLREIMLLPELEREKTPRLTRSFAVPKKYLIAAAAIICIVVAAVLLRQFVFSSAVPNVVGQSSDIAELTLKQAGFSSKIVERRFSSEKVGVVIEQSPHAQKKEPRATMVRLVVSGGTEEVIMPDIIGDNELYSTRVLTQKGLTPVIIEEPSEKPEGTVLSTNPAVGERLYTGDSVTIHISGKRQSVTLRDLNLRGQKIAIIPVYSKNGQQDPTYDVARRLSALISAAGGEPVITRSGGSKRNILTPDLRRTSTGFIWITVRDKGANGIIVSAPEGTVITKANKKSSLASSIYAELSQNTTNVRSRHQKFSADAVKNEAVKVSMGSLENTADSSLISDGQYKDLIAQSIYMGIGGYFSH